MLFQLDYPAASPALPRHHQETLWSPSQLLCLLTLGTESPREGPGQVSDRNSARIPGALAVIPLWTLLWMLKPLAKISGQSSPSTEILRERDLGRKHSARFGEELECGNG